MATTAAGARAARRAAAQRATQADPIETLDVIENIVNVASAAPEVDESEIDEAFGPESLSTPTVAAPTAPQTQTPNPQPTTAVPAPVRATSARGGALAQPMEDLSRQITEADVIIPKLRIVQAMSKTNTIFTTSRGKDGVQAGNWYHSGTNKSLGEVVYFIPVDMKKTRALFEAGQGLMCRSFDLLTGEGTPGGLCEGSYEERLTVPAEHRGCPLRRWNDRVPPKCGITYNFPGIVIQDIDNPGDEILHAMLQLRSTGTKVAREMITKVMNEGDRVWNNMVFELSLESTSNTKGTFFVPVLSDYYHMDDVEGFEKIKRRARMMARGMGNQNLRSSIEGDDTE